VFILSLFLTSLQISEVIPLISKPPSDITLSYCVLMLTQYCVDMDDTEDFNKKNMKELTKCVNEWRHSIRDCHKDMDENRLLLKDLMIQLCSMWDDSLPVENVV